MSRANTRCRMWGESTNAICREMARAADELDYMLILNCLRPLASKSHTGRELTQGRGRHGDPLMGVLQTT
jgi:hypothetical protein